ncbi:MAG: T9SS type A sorting domain-containing protein [Sphingobacteriales bacterium]|nr:MAG: T9SS type A sorting domain-containing protein [Sphingobacteriales bacterium]
MKKLLLVAVLAGIGGVATAKQVGMQTAKTVGLHFLNSRMENNALQSTSLELVYTSKAANGTADYYVFNAGNQAFVMVSADDQVKPVFGYSTEVPFDVNNIPSNATGMLKYYKDQIEYVVANNLPATAAIKTNWEYLMSSSNVAQRGNAGVTPVLPLVTTKWNQNPLYNQLCPMDGTALSVTGCVATAMAQAMKYWNYPKMGEGTHSYNSDFGPLTVDFGATTYDWNAMPSIITANNTAVATINYHAGVSVDMSYSAQSSGAYVTEDYSPVTNCAEYAFKTYFRYNTTTTRGVNRDDFSYEDWVDLLTNEIDELRPVVYAGFGDLGGHCWLADGYDADKMLHINWGWGGASNGYFDVEGMNPPSLGTGGGSGGFNYGQHAIIGLQPDVMGAPDMYERALGNNIKENAYALPTAIAAGSTVNINTEGANLHVTNDMDFYSVALPPGDNYTVTARLQDATSTSNSNTYTLNAKFAMSTNTGTSWLSYNDSTAAPLSYNGGGKLLFRVAPIVVGDTGTYRLDIEVKRIPTGVADVNNSDVAVVVYPNPASSVINIGMSDEKATIALIDMQGRIVRNTPATGTLTSIATDGLASGLYFVHIKSGDQTIVCKVTIAH